MNLDFAIQLAGIYAKEFASDHGKNSEHSAIYCARYNGYYQGYMRDCAERESLRAILRKKDEGKVTLIPTSQIDDLI